MVEMKGKNAILYGRKSKVNKMYGRKEKDRYIF